MASKKKFIANEAGLKKQNKKDHQTGGFRTRYVNGIAMNNPEYFPKKKK